MPRFEREFASEEAGQSPEIQPGFVKRPTSIEAPGVQIFPELPKVPSEFSQASPPISENPPKGSKGGRVKQDRADFVRTARERGLIEGLPFGMQEVLKQRYPKEGKPKTLSQIGFDLNIGREGVRQKEVRALTRIRRLLGGKGQADMGRPRKDIDVDEATRLYTIEEKTEEEIADLMDCSTSTISARLRAAGVLTRPKGRKRLVTGLLVWQYFVEEMSSREIAGPLGISYKTVLNRLKEAEYQLRRRTRRPRKK